MCIGTVLNRKVFFKLFAGLGWVFVYHCVVVGGFLSDFICTLMS